MGSINPNLSITQGLLEAGADVAIVDINLKTAKAAAEELQAVAVLLESDVSSYATGSKIIVDGGYTIV